MSCQALTEAITLLSHRCYLFKISDRRTRGPLILYVWLRTKLGDVPAVRPELRFTDCVQ